MECNVTQWIFVVLDIILHCVLSGGVMMLLWFAVCYVGLRTLCIAIAEISPEFYAVSGWH